MAQLDSLTYSSQLFWLVFLFFSFYSFVSLNLFPVVYSSIRVRTFIFEKIWFKSFSQGRLNKIVKYSLHQILYWLGQIIYIYLWKYQKFLGYGFSLSINILWFYLRSKFWIFGVLVLVGCNLIS